MNMHNWTDPLLADEIGLQHALVEGASKRLDELKAEAKRRGIESARGERFQISVASSERSTLDVKALRELLGDALDPYYRKSVTQTLRVKAVFQQPVLDD